MESDAKILSQWTDFVKATVVVHDSKKQKFPLIAALFFAYVILQDCINGSALLNKTLGSIVCVISPDYRQLHSWSFLWSFFFFGTNEVKLLSDASQGMWQNLNH